MTLRERIENQEIPFDPIVEPSQYGSYLRALADILALLDAGSDAKWQQHVVNELQRTMAYYKDNPASIVPDKVGGRQGWMSTFLANLWNNVMCGYPGDLPKDMDAPPAAVEEEVTEDTNLLAISYAAEEWVRGRISEDDLRQTVLAALGLPATPAKG